jgi:acetolactate decarboxylase
MNRFWVRRERVLAVLLLAALVGCTTAGGQRGTLFQYSTIDALLTGVYDGDMTFAQLKQHGDFGLGTFNALDGEMIALDGRFYQIKSDGTVAPVADTMRTPFAVVMFFNPGRSRALANVADLQSLEHQLDQELPAKNIFCAIRIEAEFATIKARSVPRQQKPYPPLVEASKKQAVFEFHNVRGTLVGFRAPEFMRCLNVPGYHFHFLTSDRQAGGHVLDCKIIRATVQVDETPTRFLMALPHGDGFQQADLTRERHSELKSVEQGAPNR